MSFKKIDKNDELLQIKGKVKSKIEDGIKELLISSNFKKLSRAQSEIY